MTGALPPVQQMPGFSRHPYIQPNGKAQVLSRAFHIILCLDASQFVILSVSVGHKLLMAPPLNDLEIYLYSFLSFCSYHSSPLMRHILNWPLIKYICEFIFIVS